MALIFLKKKELSLIRGVDGDREWTSWVGAITLVGEGGGSIHKQREVAVSPIQRGRFLSVSRQVFMAKIKALKCDAGFTTSVHNILF